MFLISSGACSESVNTLTSPSSASSGFSLTAEQLAGTWHLTSIRPAGRAEQAVPGEAVYTLTLDSGRLSTRVDCNVCGGGFAVAGQTFTTGPALACTRAACPTMAFENAYTAILAGESTIASDETALVLTSARGVLRFTR